MAGFFHGRRTTLVLFLLLAAALVVDGARGADAGLGAAPTRPSRPAMSRLYRYPLRPPKVIPPSGPSEGHNSVGPDTTLLRKP